MRRGSCYAQVRSRAPNLWLAHVKVPLRRPTDPTETTRPVQPDLTDWPTRPNREAWYARPARHDPTEPTDKTDLSRQSWPTRPTRPTLAPKRFELVNVIDPTNRADRPRLVGFREWNPKFSSAATWVDYATLSLNHGEIWAAAAIQNRVATLCVNTPCSTRQMLSLHVVFTPNDSIQRLTNYAALLECAPTLPR